MLNTIREEFWNAIEQEFEETRFGEILYEMETPPKEAKPYERIMNMARIYYLNGFNDAIEIFGKLNEHEQMENLSAQKI